MVIIGLIRIRYAEAVVARVTDAVAIGIRLICIGHIRTIIRRIRHTVAVRITRGARIANAIIVRISLIGV
jgi:hypothetical protein